MKQYNQHPDKHWCTYYASATAIANNLSIELTNDELKAISVIMERHKVWRKTWYSLDVTSKVVIDFIKSAYKKVINVKQVDVSKYEWDKLIVVSWKIDSNYVFDIKDWVLSSPLPIKWEWHARCIYKKDWVWYMVENFLWLLPFNVIKIWPSLPKWISRLWYLFY